MAIHTRSIRVQCSGKCCMNCADIKVYLPDWSSDETIFLTSCKDGCKKLQAEREEAARIREGRRARKQKKKEGVVVFPEMMKAKIYWEDQT